LRLWTRDSTFGLSLENPVSRNYAGIRANPIVICMLLRHAMRLRNGVDQSPFADDGSAEDREHRLRSFCRRIFGWGGEQAALADDAAETLLSGLARCAVIALRGKGDMVHVAHALHRRLLGPHRPFVVCNPRRNSTGGSVRSLPNRRTSELALRAAAGGAVCIRAWRLPADYRLLAPSLRLSSSTQLFVCLAKDDPVIDMLCPPLRIPSLAQRATDFDRLVEEYVEDATWELGVDSMRLSSRMLKAIVWRTTSLADLEKAVTRVVVLKSTSNVSLAAAQLGMAPVSLMRWATRRGILQILKDELGDERDQATPPGGAHLRMVSERSCWAGEEAG